MHKCNYCESILPPYYTICPVCGQPLEASVKMRFKTTTKQQSQKDKIIEDIDYTVYDVENKE